MNLRHVGITVSDIEEAITFYRDVLGFEVVRIMDESGEHIDKFSALSQVNVRTVKMKDASGGMIELLKYHSHPQQPNCDDITRIGCSHFALTVNNLDLLVEKIVETGYTINCEPQLSPDGRVKLTFCKGPDGVLLELVEELA
jgi:catechol 2,3-dioxygenase-like lactoylglutathione lyase family enzyme